MDAQKSVKFTLFLQSCALSATDILSNTSDIDTDPYSPIPIRYVWQWYHRYFRNRELKFFSGQNEKHEKENQEIKERKKLNEWNKEQKGDHQTLTDGMSFSAVGLT